MSDSQKHLEHRNMIKRKKPVFMRQEGHKKKKLGQKWRRPKGMHSKLRRMLRGHRSRVEPGWGSPKTVHGLSRSGLRRVIVANIKQLDAVNSEQDGIVISSQVGTRKRVEIVRKAKQMGLALINIDADKYIARFEEMMKRKDEMKSKAAKQKQEKQREREKKAAEKEKEAKKEAEEKPDEKEQKDQQKKELDKLLTKKDAT